MQTITTIDRRSIQVRQGRAFVTCSGLLDLAHRAGLKRIAAHLLQVPSAENGQLTICAAEVETAAGVYSGIGDASPQRVGRAIVPHLVRMAETRAKVRALKDALNVGGLRLEEGGL